jgi:hypothetical protein
LFPYIASLPLSPRNLKKPDTTHTNGLPWFEKKIEGRSPVDGRPTTLPIRRDWTE